MALINCPECSREVSDLATTCPQCGFPICSFVSQVTGDKEANKMAEGKATQEDSINDDCLRHNVDIGKLEHRQSSYLEIKVAVIVLVLFALFISYQAKKSDFLDTPPPNSALTLSPTTIDKQKWFLSAKSLLTDKSQKVMDGDYYRIRDSLNAITNDMPEYTEAQELLEKTEKMIHRIEEKQKQEERLAAAKYQDSLFTKAGKRIHKKHPDWSADDCNTIGKGQIQIGMTKDKVRAAWGSPYHINTSVGAWGTHEQWVMYETGNSYVYFENGICTSIQGGN